MKNSEVLESLFEQDKIDLNRGALFDLDMQGKDAGFDFDRIEGMLLGLAIGDALGAPSEGLTPAKRKAEYGEITEYLPHPLAGGESVGLPTDDTQLAFWTLESLVENREFKPDHVAELFTSRRIYGIGRTVRGFISAYQRGRPWYECGPRSAGNGALMRIAPMLLPHLKSGDRGLWVDTALSAMMTHNDAASTSACLAFIGMLWELLELDSAPEAEWWPQRYVELAHDLEGQTNYSPRGGRFTDFRGPLWQFAHEKLAWALQNNLSTVEACNAWYSGAFLLETVPSVLYILMRHAHDPQMAIQRAVNDTQDNDTVAAIVGAAVGALHGRRKLPGHLLEGLKGRTAASDDGRVFELISSARLLFA